MKLKFVLQFLFIGLALSTTGQEKKKNSSFEGYTNSRMPLQQNPYLELPLGAIKPQGWLREMLIRQKNGATGNLDKLYPLVMNQRNGWLGGDGDQWERGPYWIDGLLPLAYILDDKELIAKTKPLDHWTFWARYRGGDNLMVVYWLYNITGDTFLLELGNLIHKQTFDFTNAFLNTDMLSAKRSIHCVNLAQGIKEPIIYYQQHPEQKYLDATDKGFDDIRKYNGLAHGLYGGDEALHGNNPTQGSELCTAVEMMFSLEGMLKIIGKVGYADHLEKIAFN